METQASCFTNFDVLDEYLATGLSMPVLDGDKVRYPREVAGYVLDSLDDILLEVDRYEVCGSYRRGRSVISDIDIIVITDDEHFATLAQMDGCLWAGTRKVSFFVCGVQVDFRLADEESWVTMVSYFTGSREENVRLRGTAKYRGWKLNEYGLWDGRGPDANRIPCDSEEDIYRALGLIYKTPEER